MTDLSKEEGTGAPKKLSSLHSAAAKLLEAETHRILLIEDTAAHAAIIRRSLNPNLWNIEHVTRASEAIVSFELNPERIVLLDLSLPDSDGFSLLRRLHSINPQAPIIVVTATEQVSISVESMKLGACDYVVKSDPHETANKILASIQRAWNIRLKSREMQLIEESRIADYVKAERMVAVEEVLSSVCREVNNPLSGVMTLSQLLLKRTSSDTEMQELAKGISSAAAQVAEAVKKLTTISRSNPQERTMEKSDKTHHNK